jgi:hypothetical protein
MGLESCVAPNPQPREVTLGTQVVEPKDLVRTGILIDGQPRVVYTVQIPAHNSVEAIFVRGEVHVSKCNDNDIKAGGGTGRGDYGSPCEKLNNAYGYSPNVGVRLVVANDPTDPAGFGQTAWDVRACTQEKHHCAQEMTGGFFIPASGSEQYVNLVVRANHPNAGARHMIELEADCLPTANSGGFEDYSNCEPPPAESESQGGSHGKLDVMRFGQGRASDPGGVRTSNERVSRINDGAGRTVVYSVPVNVGVNDVIDVHAELWSTPTDGTPGNPYVSADVIIGDNAGDTSGKHITAWNGSNCNNPNSNPCKNRKRGAALAPAGGTRYINLVARPVRHHIQIHNSGFLDVTVRKHFWPN